jgi:hypothetical protein
MSGFFRFDQATLGEACLIGQLCVDDNNNYS